MDALTIFHISIEFWGAIFCVIALMCIAADRNSQTVDKRVKIGLQLSCLVLMVSDSLYMGLRGNPDDWVYYVVRVSKYLVFFSNYIYMCLIVVYLWQLMAEPEEEKPRRVYWVMGLSAFCVVLITISQWNGMIYYFDDVNMYHRSTFYIVIQLAVVVQIIIIFTIYMQYRKRLSRFISYAVVSFFLLSTVTTLLVVLGTKLSLQNIAVVVATQIIFAVEFIDMSQRLGRSQEAYAKANYAAHHDPMTGLCNKNWGMSQITDYINSMEVDDKATLCFVDIDDFKKINDVYGHMTGDYWIKEIAMLLHHMCRKDDVICRFGGDEYLMLLKGVADAQVLQTRVSHLHEQMESRAAEREENVHVSIGACTITGWGHSVKEAIKQADAALYEGKRNGKGKCVVYAMEKK
jgi:diguanylate cyclase (GGDEF)-like protein